MAFAVGIVSVNGGLYGGKAGIRTRQMGVEGDDDLITDQSGCRTVYYRAGKRKTM